MKKSIFRMRKSLLCILLAFVLSIVIMSAGTASPIPAVTQTNPTATVYLDPHTITGVTPGDIFTVNIMVSGSPEIFGWQAGLIFNATLLNCTGFYEGEFLKSKGSTMPTPGTINNETGVISPYSYAFIGKLKQWGAGRLAYATFEVIAPGVSDLHLSGVLLVEYPPLPPYKKAPCNIIDVYTVVVGTTPYTVVTVSNSTASEAVWVDGQRVVISGFSDHAFNVTERRIGFIVKSAYPGFSDITIPDALMPGVDLEKLTAIINGIPIGVGERTVTRLNATHYSIYFQYPVGIHKVEIATVASSTISITLSRNNITLGDSVTISGSVVSDTTPMRARNVTIQCKPSDGAWTNITATALTSPSGVYSHDWTPDTADTYDIRAKWYGDSYTYGNESAVLTLTVKGAPGIPLEIIAVAVAIIIVVAVIVVYFVKIRKPKPE